MSKEAWQLLVMLVSSIISMALLSFTVMWGCDYFLDVGFKDPDPPFIFEVAFSLFLSLKILAIPQLIAICAACLIRHFTSVTNSLIAYGGIFFFVSLMIIIPLIANTPIYLLHLIMITFLWTGGAYFLNKLIFERGSKTRKES